MSSRRRPPSSDCLPTVSTTSPSPMLLQGSGAGATGPRSVLFPWWARSSGRRGTSRVGSIPQGEGVPGPLQSQSREAWTSFPTMGRGLLLLSLVRTAQPSPAHTELKFAPSPCLSPPHEGPQNQVRRNEGCAKWLDYHLSCTVGGMRPGRDSSGTLCPPAQALHSLRTAPCTWASCFSDWQEQVPAGPPAGLSAYPPACPVFYCDPQALKPPTPAPWLPQKPWLRVEMPPIQCLACHQPWGSQPGCLLAPAQGPEEPRP